MNTSYQRQPIAIPENLSPTRKIPRVALEIACRSKSLDTGTDGRAYSQEFSFDEPYLPPFLSSAQKEKASSKEDKENFIRWIFYDKEKADKFIDQYGSQMPITETSGFFIGRNHYYHETHFGGINYNFAITTDGRNIVKSRKLLKENETVVPHFKTQKDGYRETISRPVKKTVFDTAAQAYGWGKDFAAGVGLPVIYLLSKSNKNVDYTALPSYVQPTAHIALYMGIVQSAIWGGIRIAKTFLRTSIRKKTQQNKNGKIKRKLNRLISKEQRQVNKAQRKIEKRHFADVKNTLTFPDTTQSPVGKKNIWDKIFPRQKKKARDKKNNATHARKIKEAIIFFKENSDYLTLKNNQLAHSSSMFALTDEYAHHTWTNFKNMNRIKPKTIKINRKTGKERFFPNILPKFYNNAYDTVASQAFYNHAAVEYVHERAKETFFTNKDDVEGTIDRMVITKEKFDNYIDKLKETNPMLVKRFSKEINTICVVPESNELRQQRRQITTKSKNVIDAIRIKTPTYN